MGQQKHSDGSARNHIADVDQTAPPTAHLPILGSQQDREGV